MSVCVCGRKSDSDDYVCLVSRGDAEMIDYSTQYPWNFGTLSVIMATGTSHTIYTPQYYVLMCTLYCVHYTVCVCVCVCQGNTL